MYTYESELFEGNFYVLCYYSYNFDSKLICLQFYPIYFKLDDDDFDELNKFDQNIKSDNIKKHILENDESFIKFIDLFNKQFLNLEKYKIKDFNYYIKKNNNFVKLNILDI